MLAAAASPAVVGIVVLLLTARERPVARAGAFAIGFCLVLIALGIAGLILFSHSRETFGPGGTLFAWVDVAVGAGLLAFAVVTYMRREHPTSQNRIVERVGPGACFGLGAIFMATNASALAAYAPLLREIAVADVSRFNRGVALALSDLVIIAPIAAPVVICLLAPRSSKRILAALRSGLDRHGTAVAIVTFAAIGLFLLVRGVARL